MMLQDSTRINCMDSDPETKKVFMNKCDAQSKSQKWDVGFVNRTMTDNWEKYGAKIMTFN
jgi:hypothetical protein